MKLSLIFIFILMIGAWAPLKAITLTTNLNQANPSDPYSGASKATLPAFEIPQRWTTSFSWRERAAVFLLKRLIRQEIKKSKGIAEAGKKRQGLAIASLICGILGFPTVLLYGLGSILFTLAIIFGSVALRRIAKNPGMYSGKGKALAGLICGIAGMSALIISFLILAVLFSRGR